MQVVCIKCTAVKSSSAFINMRLVCHLKICATLESSENLFMLCMQRETDFNFYLFHYIAGYD